MDIDKFVNQIFENVIKKNINISGSLNNFPNVKIDLGMNNIINFPNLFCKNLNIKTYYKIKNKLNKIIKKRKVQKSKSYYYNDLQYMICGSNNVCIRHYDSVFTLIKVSKFNQDPNLKDLLLRIKTHNVEKVDDILFPSLTKYHKEEYKDTHIYEYNSIFINFTKINKRKLNSEYGQITITAICNDNTINDVIKDLIFILKKIL